MLVALAILGAWTTSQVTLLLAPLHGPGDLAWAIPGFLLQTWLFTGLFITAHDAMHGTVSPSRPRLNRALGASAPRCTPPSASGSCCPRTTPTTTTPARPAPTPTSTTGSGRLRGLVLTFMRRYLRVRQIIILTLVPGAAPRAGPAVEPAALLVAPSLASNPALRLRDLPHPSGAEGGHTNPHNARTVDLPVCSAGDPTTGYHEEHHESPRPASPRRGGRTGGVPAA